MILFIAKNCYRRYRGNRYDADSSHQYNMPSSHKESRCLGGGISTNMRPLPQRLLSVSYFIFYLITNFFTIGVIVE